VRHRYWDLDRFPALTLDWFQRNSSSRIEPGRAFEQWNRWLTTSERPRSDEEKFKMALRLAGGVSAAAVSNYLGQERNPSKNLADKLAIKTRRDLDAICVALGRPPRYPTVARVIADVRAERHLILLARLNGVPSPRYHLAVIESIVEAGARHGFSVAIHQFPEARTDRDERLMRVLRSAVSHGLIWFRLTPDSTCLTLARQYSNSPSVVVHGDRLSYPPPVIAHILPAHEEVPGIVEMWCRGLPRASFRGGSLKRRSQTVLIAAMRPERYEGDLSPSNKAIPVSIREDRIRSIEQGIRSAGLRPAMQYIPDYSASNALAVWEDHGPFRGWVALSDELGVALKQLLVATGIDPSEAARRVLGFDGSDLARRHGVASLDQHLREIGDRTVEEFSRFHRHAFNADEPFPTCKELVVRVTLAPGQMCASS
jgi:DNA-binding LacI/PurR family transcriptional regulator